MVFFCSVHCYITLKSSHGVWSVNSHWNFIYFFPLEFSVFPQRRHSGSLQWLFKSVFGPLLYISSLSRISQNQWQPSLWNRRKWNRRRLKCIWFTDLYNYCRHLNYFFKIIIYANVFVCNILVSCLRWSLSITVNMFQLRQQSAAIDQHRSEQLGSKFSIFEL